MGETSENKPKKHICMGLLAHVDAGKTTLSESMLYLSGSIRKMGRVDHGDTFLDTYALERTRGITIFSKQAVLKIKDQTVTLLDTPGHVDFSAEMERTLSVLDYSILVINGADGVQGHTQTLWRLLRRYQVPVFLFINKMDQPGTDRQCLLEEVKRHLDDRCIDFSKGQQEEEFLENLAVCEEKSLEEYLETGGLARESIQRLIRERKVYPCYFGSALKMTGVQEFLDGIEMYMAGTASSGQFGAKVFKIARDEQGNRLTYLKITGGSLKVKDLLHGKRGSEAWEEKVNQIRIYSGAGYESAGEAATGCVCAVTGLTKTKPGDGLGCEPDGDAPILEPVLTYRLILPQDCNVHEMLQNLRQLEEEEPELHIVWKAKLGEIHVQLMGEVQIEILKSMIFERFHVQVDFGAGNIVYKETIEHAVEGVGHFEPLRHYAEVHLLLEPQERGSGLQFCTACSEDMLDRNWQRLILTHLEEKEHKGVLTGAAITDMRITLCAGKSHLKHTEGGDFRQATYRAVRQGLKRAKSILLEPYYEFQLIVQPEMVGRAMTDIQRMYGTFETPIQEGEWAILTGEAPVAAMQGYQTEVAAYTKGRGRFCCSLKGYAPCHNAEEVIEAVGYDSERDLENPTGSVFCSHGAGYVVEWDQVEAHMHLESILSARTEKEDVCEVQRHLPASKGSWQEEKELDEIFCRTYGTGKRIPAKSAKTVVDARPCQSPKRKKEEEREEYLLVDGYNIIFAWDELRKLAEVTMDGARMRLMDLLSNYQGIKKCRLILVFDAYKVEGNPGAVQKYHNIHVVYTKEAETADQYIEKTVHEIGRKYHVTVATSDRLEQVIILGQGGHRLSAQNLREEMEWAYREIRGECEKLPKGKKNLLFHQLDQELADYLEEVRLGQKEI